MIDREYVKLNSSIQTGSNCDQLEYDEEGNVKAVIELRLPENLFGSNTGPKKIENVAMQTSKFRLSMENTPIAQFPLSKSGRKAPKRIDGVESACQLDVYPYVFLNDGSMKPSPLVDNNTAFPYYKDHEIRYTILLTDPSGNSSPITLFTDLVKANTKGYGFPEDNMYYPLLYENGIIDSVENHIMNLVAQKNREMVETDESSMYAKSIATIEQMLQMALENAITYASTSDHQEVVIRVVDVNDITPGMSPSPKNDVTVHIPDRDIDVCLWTWGVDTENSTIASHLKFACKPSVKIGADYLSISYDSVAFEALVPIIYNSGFINTFEHPEQMLIDDLRKSAWGAPPPKRVYRYGVVTGEDATYNFSLPTSINAMVMNIIANKALRDSFSFLPWITVDTKKYEAFRDGGFRFNINTTHETVTRTTNVTYTQLRKLDGSDITVSKTGYLGHKYDESTYPYLPNDGQYYITYTYVIYPAHYNNDIPRYRTTQAMSYALQDGVQAVYTTSETSPIRLDTTYNRITITSDPQITVENDSSNDPSLTPGTTTSTSSSTWEASPIVTKIDLPAYEDANNVVGNYRVGYFMTRVDGEWQWVQADTSLVVLPPGNGEGQGGSWSSVAAGWAKNLPPWPEAGRNEQIYNEGATNEFKRVRRYWLQELGGDPVTVGDVTKYYTFKCVSVPISDPPPEGRYVLENVQTQTIVTESTDTTTITENDTSLVLRPKVLPNLNLDEDDKFYILDGTAANVTIGPQEVIQYDPSQEYLFKVYERKDILVEEEETQKVSRGVSSMQPPMVEMFNVTSDATIEWVGHTFTNVIGYFETVRKSNGEVVRRWFAGPKTSLGSSLASAEYEVLSTTTLPYREKEQRTEYTTSYSNDDQLEPGTTTDTVVSDPVPRAGSMDIGPTNIYKTSYAVINPNSPYDVIEGDGTYVGEAFAATEIKDMHYNTHTHEVEYEYGPIIGPVPNEGESIYIPPYMYACYSNSVDEADDPRFLRRSTWWSIAPVSGSVASSFSAYSAPIVTKTSYNDRTTTTTTTEISSIPSTTTYDGNVRLTFTWPNLPMVVMSPIASIILTLDGVEITQEIQPYNIAQPSGSSLTATIPVVENFYSFAQTLRDLHDELVVVKDQFGETATYTLNNAVGRERVLRLTAKYLAKDGTVHQIYIPPKGVFSVQLTFGLSFFYSS